MNQFSLANYLLILAAIFAHYSFGKRLHVKFFITGSLVGLSCSALIVACLANTYAGLIKPYILVSITVGVALSLYDLAGFLKTKKIDNLKVYLFLILLGVAIFLLNNPKSVFLKQGGAETLIRFNRHHSYYASQPTEMLNATYLARLKIANLYPYQWSRYHFFNSSTQALAQGLVPQPGLFTYYMAQTCIMILILLSFGEQLFSRFQLSFKNIFLFATWITIGFTLFIDALWWNFMTTGPLSIFAVIHLLFSLFSGRYNESLAYSFILGASAFRLMPIAALSIASLGLFFYRQDTIREDLQLISRLKITDYGALFFFLAYNVLTVFSGSSSACFFSTAKFDHGILYILSSYKYIGYLTSFVFRRNFFYNYDFSNFFYKIPIGSISSYLFILSLLTLGIFLIYKAFNSYQSYPRPFKFRLNRHILSIFIALGFLSLTSWQVFALHVILSPYFVASLILLYSIHKKSPLEEAPEQRKRSYAILILLTGTLLYQYTGLDHVKGPVLFIMYDVLLWGLVGIYSFTMKYDQAKLFSFSVGCILYLGFFFNVEIQNILEPVLDVEHNFIVNVTPLFQPDFRRSDYVDEDNIAKFKYEDPIVDDVYSAILGANLIYSEEYLVFMNYRFIHPPPTVYGE